MQTVKRIDAPLYVITSITNPRRYHSRYRLYRQFERYIEESGAVLYTVEQRFRDREFEITAHDNPRHLQVVTESELWHKENLLNLLIQRLPSDWEYVAWIDADVVFARPDWVQETLHLLQHYQVIQMFSQAADLDPHYRLLHLINGVVYGWRHGQPLQPRYGEKNHPGYAWACRRDAINHLGGLIDWAIVGSGDWHMACALLGEVDSSFVFHPALYTECPVYVQWIVDWARRSQHHIRHNVGYMDGILMHYWHGNKANRKYRDRWQILTRNKFDPLRDLKRDWQGVWQLTDHNSKLRDDLRAYFANRNEDDIVNHERAAKLKLD